uniref:C2H2-type domain-containing protein n=1 Tax=Magallana gigas TaxID=29159 RepID=A0A8W8MI46_MAGGI
MTRISEKLLLKDENLVFSGVKQPDPKPTTIQGVKQQDHFPCIDPDCIKVFRKENQLVQHLSVGQHVYDEQQFDTLEDRSKRLWSAQCSELRLNQQILSSVPVVFEQPTNFCESHGYALKRRKQTSRFSGKIRSFFGNLCLKKKKVSNIVKGEESAENDEDLQNVISDLVAVERSQVLSSIVSELTLG